MSASGSRVFVIGSMTATPRSVTSETLRQPPTTFIAISSTHMILKPGIFSTISRMMRLAHCCFTEKADDIPSVCAPVRHPRSLPLSPSLSHSGARRNHSTPYSPPPSGTLPVLLSVPVRQRQRGGST